MEARSWRPRAEPQTLPPLGMDPTFAHQVADDADGSQASPGKNRLPSAVRMVSPMPSHRDCEPQTARRHAQGRDSLRPHRLRQARGAQIPRVPPLIRSRAVLPSTRILDPGQGRLAPMSGRRIKSPSSKSSDVGVLQCPLWVISGHAWRHVRFCIESRHSAGPLK
jgi:hypothetical protein